jgi:hypothetical protein
MKIDAEVKSISKLKEYFFLVPDYQREYVWKPDDQVEQFMIDIENEFEVDVSRQQNNYFIGSIIIVKNKEKYDVVDGQQRLTTIMISLCAFRDLLKSKEDTLNTIQKKYLQNIEELLFDFDMETDQTKVRLELQYHESCDYLDKLIQGDSDSVIEKTPSIVKMEGAYNKILEHLLVFLRNGIDELTSFAKYFLTKIDLVIIESENLSSALKIFETINQRGAGLNAMDLVKNLLFSQTKKSDFNAIKDIWKDIIKNLQDCGEDQNPLRFLRYFLMARYYNGIMREDDIYKWIISPEGKNATKYETHPLSLAKELRMLSKRYSELIIATELMQDGGEFPNTTNIGFANKYKSRQHLIMLLALHENSDKAVIEYVSEQLESFFFYSSTLRIQAKNNERLLVMWAEKVRGLSNIEKVSAVLQDTMLPYLIEKVSLFKQEFITLGQWVYNPLYRLRYVLGKIENTILQKTNNPLLGHNFINNLQIEHILPQTPKDGVIPNDFVDINDYNNYVGRMGNVTLLESTINQVVNNCNDLTSDDWFHIKQKEYSHSAIFSTKLLDNNFSIGLDTSINRLKNDMNYSFDCWSKKAIEKRQDILLDLIFDTWRINNKRIDRI